MARELDAILDHGEANRAASCRTESGVSFLEQIICPIYETMAAVSGSLLYSYGFEYNLGGYVIHQSVYL